jgi:hypothetical protein
MTFQRNAVLEPNPRDRGSVYTPLWIAWIVAFAVIEGKALWDEAHARPGNRVKRTLSSHLRFWAAYDSPTGIPLDARLGKTRRFVLSTAIHWFGNHIDREGEQ